MHITEAYLKSCYCYILFCHSKNPSTIMENIFNSIFNSIIFNSIKNFLVKENKYLFFDVMKHGHIFPSNACHFQYDHRETGNIRTCKNVRLKKF